MPWAAKERTRRFVVLGRARLIKEMGSKCVRCGARSDLQFHHTNPRQWVSAKVSQWVRLARQKREYQAGFLVLACGLCNRVLGQPTGPAIPLAISLGIEFSVDLVS